MRVIPPALHRGLDFVTVLVFALAPAVLHLGGFPAALAYLLAAVHLAMTVLTGFTPQARRPVPLGLHGAVEGVVGAALVALPWVLGWTGAARVFFLGAGVVILLVWTASRYE